MKNINTLIEKYQNNLIDEEKAPATVEKYLRDVKTFFAWVGERKLEKQLVLEYKNILIGSLAPASVNSVLSSLNSFFTYNEWYSLRVRSLKLQKRIFASSDKELTKTEYARLLEAAKKTGNEQLYLLMQTICSTGIRVSELKYITCESAKKGSSAINLKGKMRMIILPNDLCKLLISYAKSQKIESGCIFVSKRGRPLDRSNIWKMMKSLCDEANVQRDKVFPHNLRHLFARTFYSMRKDIVRLADILGHTSINTTRIYTMETGDVHRMQIQKLGLLFPIPQKQKAT